MRSAVLTSFWMSSAGASEVMSNAVSTSTSRLVMVSAPIEPD